MWLVSFWKGKRLFAAANSKFPYLRNYYEIFTQKLLKLSTSPQNTTEFHRSLYSLKQGNSLIYKYAALFAEIKERLELRDEESCYLFYKKLN